MLCLRSPKGGCCSISDDFSCSSINDGCKPWYKPWYNRQKCTSLNIQHADTSLKGNANIFKKNFGYNDQNPLNPAKLTIVSWVCSEICELLHSLLSESWFPWKQENSSNLWIKWFFENLWKTASFMQVPPFFFVDLAIHNDWFYESVMLFSKIIVSNLMIASETLQSEIVVQQLQTVLTKQPAIHLCYGYNFIKRSYVLQSWLLYKWPVSTNSKCADLII